MAVSAVPAVTVANPVALAMLIAPLEMVVMAVRLGVSIASAGLNARPGALGVAAFEFDPVEPERVLFDAFVASQAAPASAVAGALFPPFAAVAFAPAVRAAAKRAGRWAGPCCSGAVVVLEMTRRLWLFFSWPGRKPPGYRWARRALVAAICT